jgi:hypothetical protein
LTLIPMPREVLLSMTNSRCPSRKCKMMLGRFPAKWEEFLDEQGGMEVVCKTIWRRRQSSADGQKKNFWSYGSVE